MRGRQLLRDISKLDVSERMTEFQQSLRDFHYTNLAGTGANLAQSVVQKETQPRLAEQTRCYCSTSRTTMPLKHFSWITGAL